MDLLLGQLAEGFNGPRADIGLLMCRVGPRGSWVWYLPTAFWSQVLGSLSVCPGYLRTSVCPLVGGARPRVFVCRALGV